MLTTSAKKASRARNLRDITYILSYHWVAYLEIVPLFCYHIYVNTTRQQQLLSRIKRIVSTELHELDHERFHTVVVTSVLLSNDGRSCRVWVTAPDDIIRELNGATHNEIQKRFTKQYVRKVVPKLQFVSDMGDIDHLEQLLEAARDEGA